MKKSCFSKNKIFIKKKLILICACCALIFSLITVTAFAISFPPRIGSYLPAGDLITGSGTGQTISPEYLKPHVIISFPYPIGDIEIGKFLLPIENGVFSYANSQVYRDGGSKHPSPEQCVPTNYSFPWQDNFCETRTNQNSKSINCPAKTKVHLGQDIRPATCKKDTHWAVAAEPGQIYSVGSFSLQIKGDSGFIHHYLHLDKNSYKKWKNLLNKKPTGVRVIRGERLGLISNNAGRDFTTFHLHYELRDTDNEPLSPYETLVSAHGAAVSCQNNPNHRC
jgi:hypothetical protein